MLRLRPYKQSDANDIVSWLQDETTFKRWNFNRFEKYPITSDDLNLKYFNENYYPFTAFDDCGTVGHLTMWFTDKTKQVLRFGFIIVDSSKRKKGYGKEMLNLALKYAFEILKVKKVTIGVFENNPSALNCYKSVGFKEISEEFYNVMNEKWRSIELEITSDI